MAPVNVMVPVISFLCKSGFSLVVFTFISIYVTLMAYSPSTVSPIFCAISDCLASMMEMRPFQFGTNWLFLQFGHSLVSVSILHRLHACFLLIFSSRFSFLLFFLGWCFLLLSSRVCLSWVVSW